MHTHTYTHFPQLICNTTDLPPFPTWTFPVLLQVASSLSPCACYLKWRFGTPAPEPHGETVKTADSCSPVPISLNLTTGTVGVWQMGSRHPPALKFPGDSTYCKPDVGNSTPASSSVLLEQRGSSPAGTIFYLPPQKGSLP